VQNDSVAGARHLIINFQGVSMHRSFIAAIAVAVLFLSSGCASIVSGHNQSLSVETPGCTPANCQLTNTKGSWFVITPGTVVVHRAYGDLTVECKKDGVQPIARDIKSSTKGMAFGNILLGGVIGAGVDIGTGAAYDYPPVISIPLLCGANSALPGNKVAEAENVDGAAATPTATPATEVKK